MKKSFVVLLAAVLGAAMVIPAAAEVPTPWFELGYQDGQPVDLQGNLEVAIQAGEVVNTTVTYDGKAYDTVAFVGNEDQEGMTVELPFDEETYGQFLLGGCTYELFIELESLADGTSGFFSCVNGGGSSLYYRNGGDKKQLQFQIGTDDNSAADFAWGAYAGAGHNDAANGPVYLEAGRILHCVGTYNKETNLLSVYLDGQLGSTGSYGNGNFKLGGGFEDVLGIGINPAYPSESYAVNGDEFRVVGARLYKTTLTDEQVAEEYANCIAALTGEAVSPAEEAPAEEAPVEEAPVEEAPVEEAPVEEAPAEEAPVEEAPAAEEVVVEAPVITEEETAAAPVLAAPQTFDAALIGAVAAITAAAGYAISKKH